MIYRDDGLNELRYAIIKRACKDYYIACKADYESNGKKELKRFFYSDWYRDLCNVDPRTLLREIEYRAKHGTALFKDREALNED